MGDRVWLICEKCKKIAFLAKNSPIKENINMQNLEDFLFLHFSGLYGQDEHCNSAFKLMSDLDDMPEFDGYQIINI